jgi:hypothetical protein
MSDIHLRLLSHADSGVAERSDTVELHLSTASHEHSVETK